MSKKTRQEKILADRRRRSQPPPITLAKQPSALKTAPPELQPQSQSIHIYPVQLIEKDLTRTLGLCILAISLEVALFLILEKRLSLPWKIGL